MSNTPAGLRDCYLTVWTKTSSTGDAAGQLVPSYTKKWNLWGQISNAMPAAAGAAGVRGQSESWATYHMNVDAKYVARVSYFPGLAATDKISEQTRSGTVEYEIAGDPISDGDELIIPLALKV